MENQNTNIVDDLLVSKSYIILLSGLEQSPILKVSEDLMTAFSTYAIDLDFMHLPFTDKSDKIQTRISDLLTKNQIIIVRAQNYNGNMSFKNSHIVRINLSINSTILNDVELLSRYKASLLDSGINKYFNFKTGVTDQDYNNSIYWYIIDDIERRVYGSQYKRLSHKYYEETNGDKTKSPEGSRSPKNNSYVPDFEKPVKQDAPSNLEFQSDSPDERFEV
jgi:hypothetical protein